MNMRLRSGKNQRRGGVWTKGEGLTQRETREEVQEIQLNKEEV